MPAGARARARGSVAGCVAGSVAVMRILAHSSAYLQCSKAIGSVAGSIGSVAGSFNKWKKIEMVRSG